jgi:acetyl-CoA/propionyl-CoA carboxylase biotin carboxyl carrier protein
MLRALGETEVIGVHTTMPAQVVVLEHPDFIAGTHSTRWLEEEVDASAWAEPAASSTATAPVEGAPAPEPLVERTVPVEVDGRRFSVKVWLPEMTAAAPSGAPVSARASRPRTSASSGASGGGTISSPMQGTIVKVLVGVGDTVEAGEALLVLEAMKMENHINAEIGGTVSELRVAVGETVGAGDVVVVIEP